MARAHRAKRYEDVSHEGELNRLLVTEGVGDGVDAVGVELVAVLAQVGFLFPAPLFGRHRHERGVAALESEIAFGQEIVQVLPEILAGLPEEARNGRIIVDRMLPVDNSTGKLGRR